MLPLSSWIPTPMIRHATQPMEDSVCIRIRPAPSTEDSQTRRANVIQPIARSRLTLRSCASSELLGISVQVPMDSMSIPMETLPQDAVVPVVTTTHWAVTMVAGTIL